MGKRGPKPLPREVKQRRGTLRPSREVKNPITGLPPLGRAPVGMSKEERKVWTWLRTHAPHLRDVDALLVRRLCEAEIEYSQMSALVAKDGPIQVSLKTGFQRPSAAMTLKRNLRAELVKMYAEIGTPSSRGRIEMPESDEYDADAEFLFGPAKLRSVK